MQTEDNNEEIEKISNISTQFEQIKESLFSFKQTINSFQNQIKQLEKNINKELKNLKKEANKNKSKGNRKPSGFANPSKVSKELCEFLNKKEGTEIARTEVTKAIISYIDKNNLKNENNKQFITPDEKLKFLLGINDGEELTFFTLQKYMNKHFIKKNSSIKIVENI